jgi:hypothetical protein
MNPANCAHEWGEAIIGPDGAVQHCIHCGVNRDVWYDCACGYDEYYCEGDEETEP